MEPKKSILKNSNGEIFVSVFYDPTLGATTDIWTGDFESQQNFILGLDLILHNMVRNKSRKWLADLSLIKGDFSFVREYIPTNIIPIATKAGLRYEALVLPHDVFSMLSVQVALFEINEDIEIRLFDNAQEAKDWLKSKP